MTDAKVKDKPKKRGSGAFDTLQKLSKSFFLPISLLPFAGILFGLGASFTNPTTLEMYNLTGAMGPGTVLGLIMEIFNVVGGAVFANLALLFAVAVALGLANADKEVAALAAVVAFIVMHVTINLLMRVNGDILSDGTFNPDLPLGSTAEVLGIQTLETGVFGGIICGLMVARLHNKYYRIELPEALSFFGGTRFVPIISTIGAIILGAIFYLIWPTVQGWISSLGNLVANSGYVGSFIFGFLERALIPFGLHHAFYIPLWQTELGGSMEVAGQMVYGAQKIYFAQLADPSRPAFSMNAVRLLVGKFPFMMGGLPAAAYAMYRSVPKERRSKVKGLYFSSALTSFLTGITEPIEFTFLFLSPSLFLIHCVTAGLSFVLCHALNIAVGTTFSDGLIDFIIFGVLPGNDRTNWLRLVILILVYAVLYYFMFSFFIRKLDVQIPGRAETDEGEEVKLYTKEDYLKQQAEKSSTNTSDKDNSKANKSSKKLEADNRSAAILEGIGGLDNLTTIDNCATRLRLTVKDSSLIDEGKLKKAGAMGILHQGNGVQIVYGPKVSLYKADLEDYIHENYEDSDF